VKKLYLRQTGGFGGLDIAGSIDAIDLTDDLRQRATEVLAREKLAEAAVSSDAGHPDSLQYEISVWSDGGAHASFTIDESAATPEQLEVVDELLGRILSTRKGAGNG